jgi:hypothetical protein
VHVRVRHPLIRRRCVPFPQPHRHRSCQQCGRTAEVGWIFLGFLTLFFGILPAATTLNAFLRSRRGATMVEMSKQGVRIRQRGAWTIQTTASLAASDILDVDYTRPGLCRRFSDACSGTEVMQSYPEHFATASPRVERLVAALTRFVRNKG